MKFVSTRHANGCAIAAIAMLTGISYNKVYKQLRVKSERKFPGTTLERSLKGLTRLGCKNYRITFNKIDISKLKHSAYISINMKCGTRHAVVWDTKSKKIYDSGKFKYVTKSYIKKNLNYIIELLP